MKKDESSKVDSVKDKGIKRNDGKIETQRQFPGCDTCKLKYNIPLKKTRTVQDSCIKSKKKVETDNGKKTSKIKLTDLCQEDKKMIMELMTEISKFAEENRRLKENMGDLEKTRKEQHDYLLKQANLHLEEKNLYLNEIQAYKVKIQELETNVKEKANAWETRERQMDAEIQFLAKALWKLSDEKSDLLKEVTHLKTCLKHSLEASELLRNEGVATQRLSVKSTSTSSGSHSTLAGEKGPLPRVEESENDRMCSAKDQPTTDQMNNSSLDMINNKLQHLYGLLQYRLPTSPAQNVAAPTTALPPEFGPSPSEEQNAPQTDPPDRKKSLNAFYGNRTHQEDAGKRAEESNYKFLKPFNECDKTSIQAERILKEVERPFSVRFEQKSGERLDEKQEKGSSVTKIISDKELDEDRILSELFYPDIALDCGIQSDIIYAARRNLLKTIRTKQNLESLS